MNLLNKFVTLENSRRYWAIGSVHGNLLSIKNIHDLILKEFSSNDKIIYLGNVVVVGSESSNRINESINYWHRWATRESAKISL